MTEQQNIEATFATVYELAGDVLHAYKDTLEQAIREQFKARFAKDFPEHEALELSFQTAVDEVTKTIYETADALYGVAGEHKDELIYQKILSYDEGDEDYAAQVHRIYRGQGLV